MEWIAKWIWAGEAPEPARSQWIIARKILDLEEAPQNPRLHITADSRYVLWVNGERIGQGPIRSWPSALHYDTYDLSGRLHPGKNEVDILAVNYGVATFQYIPGPGGLLAQIEWEANGKPYWAGTDSSWQVAPHPGYDRRTPRISCQQGWVEHLDARPGLYWQKAVERGPAGMAPWTSLVPRPIPFLTEEPVYPVRILSTRRVQAPEQVWAFDLRPNLLPGYFQANRMWLHGFVATVVHAAQAETVTIETQSMVKGRLRVNGQDAALQPPTNRWAGGWKAQVTLQPGDNLLLFDVTGYYHEWGASYVVNSHSPLQPRAPFGEDARFVTLGPVEEPEKRAAIWQARAAGDLAPFAALAQPIRAADEVSAHVFDLITLARPTGGSPAIDGLDNLCGAHVDATVIHPAANGEDSELIIDFGRMTVGLLEFEVEADPGVILDGCGFESVQEATLDYTWGLNNVLRYVTRGGVQRYTSVVRRGFRYFNLTVRNLTSPIKIRWLRTLLNTYPVVEKGSFMCDDWALNEIWRIGRYTARLCSEDTYVDCPTYEQTFWVGDSRNESLVNLTAFGTYGLTRHCLLLAAQSLERSALVESQVPSGWQNILTAWSLLWVLEAEEYYRLSGDRALLERIYPAICEQGRRIEAMLNKDGLLRIEAWNMLDWAPMDTPGDGIITHQNAWLAEAYRRTATLAGHLSQGEEAAHWDALAEKVAGGINRVLWDEARQAYIDCIRPDGTRSPVVSQQTNLVAYLCRCVPPERTPAIKRLIKEPPEGVIHAGSPFAMFFILEALGRMGEHELILELTRKGWGMMIDRGATTCWEMFPGYEHGGRWTRSHCHAWSAAPTYFLSLYQLGIDALEPGFARARIAPQPAGLQWARGQVPTPHGPLAVSWELAPEGLTISVSLPPGVSAELVPPRLAGDYRGITLAAGSAAHPMHPGTSWQVELEPGAQVTITFLL